MKKFVKKVWLFVVVVLLVVILVVIWNFICFSEVNVDENGSNVKIKNVIVLIGDGMGFLYMMVYCYMKDNLKIFEMEFIEFDKYFVGI